MRPLPRITIVTPSYNQAQFLEQTLDSVLSQHYPNLEYMVIDGGSTDSSPQILQKYAKYLAYHVSEKDHGQSHALNKAFARATGSIYAYLNSDDLYTPGTLHQVAEAWAKPHLNRRSPHPDRTWVVGDVSNFGDHIEDHLTRYTVEKFRADRWVWLYHNPVHQPGAFWSADLHREFGPFDTTLRYVFDYELFIKFRILGTARPRYIPQTLARFRHHDASKTVTERPLFEPEFEAVRARISAQLSPGALAQMQRYPLRVQADVVQARALQYLRERRRLPALRDLAWSLWQDPRLLVQRRTLGALKRFIRIPSEAGATHATA